MKQFLMASWLPGCLAALAIAGSASEVSAFQEREQIIIQPNVERQAEQRTTLTGEFTSQHQGMVTIKREGQNPRSFRTTEQTEVIINDRPARLEDLRKGDRIQVTEGVGGIVLRIEAERKPGQRPAESVETPAQDTERPAQETTPWPSNKSNAEERASGVKPARPSAPSAWRTAPTANSKPALPGSAFCSGKPKGNKA